MPNERASGSDRDFRLRFRGLTFVAAALTYGLIVFGGIVRITGSGMGCGEDWPLCNGRLIPEFTFQTLIEYGHRTLAALVSFMVLAVVLYAIRHRRARGIQGSGGVFWAITAAILLVAQVLVGAITVELALPTSTVVLHLAVASALLATLLLAGMSVRPDPDPIEIVPATQAAATWAKAGAALGFVVLLFGGLVANTGASPLCPGFPLCGGRLFPEGGVLVHLHWTHRLLAYALFLYLSTATIVMIRRGVPQRIRAAIYAALGLVLVQVAVAAAMVLSHLPPALRALHLAVGVALWAALLVWAATAILARGGRLAPGAAVHSRSARPAGEIAS